MGDAIAILLAAGSGARMGRALPKALLPIAGRTVLARSLDILLSCGQFSRIIVAVPNSFIVGEHAAAFSSLALPPMVTVVQGGTTRALSVRSGLAVLDSSCLPKTLVAVHDAARCMVSVDLITRVIESARRAGAATAAVPCFDTIVQSGPDQTISQTLDRSKLWAVQTPQVFELELLRDAHRDGNKDATDDATLVHRFHPVEIVPGDRHNLKITTVEDLAWAEKILSAQLDVETTS